MSIDKFVNNFLEKGLFLTYNTARFDMRDDVTPHIACGVTESSSLRERLYFLIMTFFNWYQINNASVAFWKILANNLVKVIVTAELRFGTDSFDIFILIVFSAMQAFHSFFKGKS